MLVKETNIYNKDLYTIWNDDRIKEAFNFGKGTKKDMIKYMRNNKKLAKFKIIEWK